MRETARAKANRLLLEGRLVITSVIPNDVRSSCRGEGAIWHQAYSRGRWLCDCPVRTDACSHLIALRRVVAIDLKEHQ